MSAGAHRHPCPVDHHRHVMGVDALQREGHDRALARRVAEDAQRIDFPQAFVGVVAQFLLMGEDGVAADLLHIFERGSQPDGLHDGRRAGLEAVRRIVADVLLGNGDNHLKNWSFIFPEPGQVRLSPAYDIVPTFLFIPGDRMALRFVGTHQFEIVNLHRFERVASFVQVDPKWIAREVKATVQRALDLWPMAAPELLGEERGNRIIERLSTLQLVRETRA